MDVFDLDEKLLDNYTAFARSFTRIRSIELQGKVDALYADRQFWPEPLIQLNPYYEDGGTLRELVGADGLSEDTAKIFTNPRSKLGDSDRSIRLRRHQEQAIGLALSNKSYVVTTGTGSGKSLCFFIPIVDAIVKAKRAGEPQHTRAIVIYPGRIFISSALGRSANHLRDVECTRCAAHAWRSDPQFHILTRFTSSAGRRQPIR